MNPRKEFGPHWNQDIRYWTLVVRASAFAACTIALMVAGGAPFHAN